MDIAYIVPKLANKGPVIVVKELVRMMTAHGHKCVVYYFDEEKEIDMPCSTERITMKQKIDFNAFDIIHSHGLRPDMYVYRHKPGKCRARTVTTLHNYVYDDFKYEYNRFIAITMGTLWIKIVGRHDRVVTLSRDAMKYYSRWIRKDKLRYAYNTREIEVKDDDVDAQEVDMLAAFRNGCTLIGVNAALTERKGVDQIIKALPELKEHKLVIIGEGKVKESLKELAKDKGVAERVLFMGYRKDAHRYLKYYDIYALPSRSEGFVLTLLEAAIYRKKVVCSDIPIFKETVSEKEAAFFRTDDTGSLVKAILSAGNNETMGNCLYERYVSMYSPECFYNKYMSIYKE